MYLLLSLHGHCETTWPSTESEAYQSSLLPTCTCLLERKARLVLLARLRECASTRLVSRASPHDSSHLSHFRGCSQTDGSPMPTSPAALPPQCGHGLFGSGHRGRPKICRDDPPPCMSVPKQTTWISSIPVRWIVSSMHPWMQPRRMLADMRVYQKRRPIRGHHRGHPSIHPTSLHASPWKKEKDNAVVLVLMPNEKERSDAAPITTHSNE